MVLEIINNEALNGIKSIKGVAPLGATYEDGEAIRRQINIAFVDQSTGDYFLIEYKKKKYGITVDL